MDDQIQISLTEKNYRQALTLLVANKIPFSGKVEDAVDSKKAGGKKKWERELIQWIKKHYWDSLEKDKDLILRHMRTFVDSEAFKSWIDVEKEMPAELKEVIIKIYQGDEFVSNDLGFVTPDGEWVSNLFIQNVPEWKVTQWMHKPE